MEIAETRRLQAQAGHIIDVARKAGRAQNLSADMVADIAVPGGALPEDHPAHLTDDDPWSVVWDEADTILHAR